MENRKTEDIARSGDLCRAFDEWLIGRPGGLDDQRGIRCDNLLRELRPK